MSTRSGQNPNPWDPGKHHLTIAGGGPVTLCSSSPRMLKRGLIGLGRPRSPKLRDLQRDLKVVPPFHSPERTTPYE
ncbi:hypothetical protein OAI33_08345 [Pirellulaceae bacterium]|nr:hypothetical protein [Pirellulaceae bacterium]